jgi:hypothetical protein
MALCRSCEKKPARVHDLCGACAARALRVTPLPAPRVVYDRKEQKVTTVARG